MSRNETQISGLLAAWNDDGLPYFVMELVDGERLDHFCESRSLDVEERLRLFLRVCAAVETAHRNLVVHRDLKPSNILVANGEPKLLDFGIAKLLHASEEARSVLTDAGSSPMTPEYASPEQRHGEAVTTASDVYSLGVVLRGLLGEQDAGSDLGSIVAKALREEPEERYGSIAQFADDLRRASPRQRVASPGCCTRGNGSSRPKSFFGRSSRHGRSSWAWTIPTWH